MITISFEMVTMLEGQNDICLHCRLQGGYSVSDFLIQIIMHKISNISKMLAVAPKTLTSTEAATLTVRYLRSSLSLT